MFNSRRYSRALIILFAGVFAFGIAGCGDDENPVTTDTTPPTVTSVSPANAATNVSLNANITASFSEAMDPSTISGSTFTLKYGTTSVAGTVTYSANPGATFDPSAPLLPNTVYTAGITTGAKDAAGNALEVQYTWAFTTGSTSTDVTPPIVVATVPMDASVGAAVGTNITATFSEAINPATVNTTTFLLLQGTTAITGTVSYSGNTATFDPSAALANETEYTATVTTGIADVAGNVMVQAYSWTFTTVEASDVTPPTVVSTVPANTAVNIAVSANVSATFNEAMDPSTITTSTFTLMQGATPVAGAVSYSGATAAFNPTSDLSVNTVYTATITTGAEDVAGNAIASAHVWTFTTSPAPDVTPPTVISTIPANGATNVSTVTSLTVSFSEAMNPGSISASTFTLFQGTTQYDGSVTYSSNTATFNPNSELAPGVVYTATILTGATDLAGNALATAYVWTFTTVPPPDVTPPGVVSTFPANGAISITTAATLTAEFSEPLNPATVTTSTFILMQGTTSIAGVVTYSGNTASFNPDVALASMTAYTATITTGVMDIAGNSMTADYSWSFTTDGEVNPDVPTVVAVAPNDEEVDVATVTNITATFSESMNPATINTSTFTVTDGSTIVPGVVSYSGATATFNPSVRLDTSKIYAATITTGAMDLVGNALAEDYAWVFITEPAPELAITVPADLDFGIPINAKVAISFSKEMDASAIIGATFTLLQGGTPVTGTVSYAGFTAVFTPSANLSPTTSYAATVTTSATDLSGNPLNAAIGWTFTTRSGVDVESPVVNVTVPDDGATGVPRGEAIRAFFNDKMDPSTLSNASFAVTSASGAAVGVVTYEDGQIGRFLPTVLLEANTVYTVTILTAVTDISGNAMAAAKVWTFTTGP